MDGQVDSEYTIHDLVAQGACYPLAMMVWQHLTLRRTPVTKADFSGTMIHSSCAFDLGDTGGDVGEAALN